MGDGTVVGAKQWSGLNSAPVSTVRHMDGRPRSNFGRLVDLDNYVEAISRLSQKRLSALAVLGRFLSTGLVTNTIFRYDFLKNMKNLPLTRITQFLDLLKHSFHIFRDSLAQYSKLCIFDTQTFDTLIQSTMTLYTIY